jgi:hypothetical protein
MTILWWIIGVTGALFLLFLLWRGYQTSGPRRFQSTVSEYLTIQNAEEALEYVEEHPFLLAEATVDYVQARLNRNWASGDVHKFVAGIPLMALLVRCQEYGIDIIRESEMMDEIQAQMSAVASPAWQRAMDVLKMMTIEEGAASVPAEEVDEDLVESMEQIMEWLRPLAVDEETRALQDEVVHILRRMLEQKDK